jgi:hypothetical protein
MAHPLLYEINTRCWLRELSEAHGQPVTLGSVPEAEFLQWQRLGFTHIWLMGVWTGGPRARAQALASPDLAKAFSEALPDWTEPDVGPSPYAIAAYRVPASLGGEKGLDDFRRKLNAHGLKLLLDFVPNHLGVDHPWVQDRSELFVNSTRAEPDTFPQQTVNGLRHLAYGKDPYCPAWSDTVQLDYRRAETRAAMTGLLEEVAGMCDGVRCDMAMLLLNEVFANTWKKYPVPGPRIEAEFWADATSAVRRRHNGFLFVAEVYWGLEGRLQSLGFDYTYDKTLYDRLTWWEAGTVQKHLLGLSVSYLSASAHFLENHDEPRVASKLQVPAHRAAALIILGLPGMRFLHEGQLSGLQRRLTVQLLRRMREPENAEIRQMYDQLLCALRVSAIGQGTSALLTPTQAWPDNPTAQHFILIQWTGPTSAFNLVAVNLAPHRSQCYAPVQLPTSAQDWTLNDLLGKDRFVRSHDDLEQRGLYLDLPPHGAQILHFELSNETRPA